jgi:hypothetical protein
MARRASVKRNRGVLLVFVLIGAIVLAGAGVGAYFVFRPRPDTDTASQSSLNSRRIVVSKAGGENTAATLLQALAKAGPGDTIVIAEPRIVEPTLRLDNRKHKDLTIESATPDGKPAVIEFNPSASSKGGIMLDAPHGIEGLKIRNVEFDGKGQAERGLQLVGVVSGTTLEGVTIRGVQTTGFYLRNVAGAPDRPLILDRVRVVLNTTTQAGLESHALGELTNKHIIIKNSRFEGPGKSGVRFDGPVADLELSNNRFFNLTCAVSIVKPNGKPSRATIVNNTVYRASVGLQFEVPAKDATVYEFKVVLNYFGRTDALLQAPGPIPGLTSEQNINDAHSAPGNPPLVSEKRAAPALADPDQADDASFLRFPGQSGPTIGPNKARVGAQ